MPERAEVIVVDCGMGNVASVVNMLRRVGARVAASADPAVVRTAGRLVLPGVGSFDEGMRRLTDAAGLLEALERRVIGDGVPLLGICLGLQLLTRGSEEGARPGLGWLRAATVRLRPAPGAKVPHMGWNTVEVKRAGGLFEGAPPEPRFYFVHSYHVVCDDPSTVAATCDHGGTVVAAVEQGNVGGTQFHPEKSHRFGMQLLRAFAGTGRC